MYSYTGTSMDNVGDGWHGGGSMSPFTQAVNYQQAIQYQRFEEDQRQIQEANMRSVANVSESSMLSENARRSYSRQAEMDRLSHISGVASSFGEAAIYEGTGLMSIGGVLAGAGGFFAGGAGSLLAPMAIPMATGAVIANQFSKGVNRYVDRKQATFQTAMDFDMYGSSLGFTNNMSYYDATGAAENMQASFGGNGFFDRDQSERIHKIGMSNGMLNAKSINADSGTMAQYKENFKTLVDTTEEVVKLLNTTIEGGMSVMGELSQNGIKMGQMKQYITEMKAASDSTGLSTQNMMSLGAAGANAVQNTGIRADIGSTMYQMSAARAADINNTMGTDSVARVGGIANAGATLANAQINTFKSGFGTRMAVYAMNSDGSINEGKLNKLLKGDISSDELMSGSDAVADKMGSSGRALIWRDKEDFYNNLSDRQRKKLYQSQFDIWKEGREGSEEALRSVYAGTMTNNTKERRLLMDDLAAPTAYDSMAANYRTNETISEYKSIKHIEEKDRENRSTGGVNTFKDIMREVGEAIQKSGEKTVAALDRTLGQKGDDSFFSQVAANIGLTDGKGSGGFWGKVGRDLGITNKFKSHGDVSPVNMGEIIKKFTGVTQTDASARGNKEFLKIQLSGGRAADEYDGFEENTTLGAIVENVFQSGSLNTKDTKAFDKMLLKVADGMSFTEALNSDSGQVLQSLGIEKGSNRWKQIAAWGTATSGQYARQLSAFRKGRLKGIGLGKIADLNKEIKAKEAELDLDVVEGSKFWVEEYMGIAGSGLKGAPTQNEYEAALRGGRKAMFDSLDDDFKKDYAGRLYDVNDPIMTPSNVNNKYGDSDFDLTSLYAQRAYYQMKDKSYSMGMDISGFKSAKGLLELTKKDMVKIADKEKDRRWVPSAIDKWINKGGVNSVFKEGNILSTAEAIRKFQSRERMSASDREIIKNVAGAVGISTSEIANENKYSDIFYQLSERARLLNISHNIDFRRARAADYKVDNKIISTKDKNGNYTKNIVENKLIDMVTGETGTEGLLALYKNNPNTFKQFGDIDKTDWGSLSKGAKVNRIFSAVDYSMTGTEKVDPIQANLDYNNEKLAEVNKALSILQTDTYLSSGKEYTISNKDKLKKLIKFYDKAENLSTKRDMTTSNLGIIEAELETAKTSISKEATHLQSQVDSLTVTQEKGGTGASEGNSRGVTNRPTTLSYWNNNWGKR